MFELTLNQISISGTKKSQTGPLMSLYWLDWFKNSRGLFLTNTFWCSSESSVAKAPTFPGFLLWRDLEVSPCSVLSPAGWTPGSNAKCTSRGKIMNWKCYWIGQSNEYFLNPRVYKMKHVIWSNTSPLKSWPWEAQMLCGITRKQYRDH